tara:strand:+ start:5927 stop:6118 length:192 start_codon:yes stop_codon:yes gene_type:complete
MSTMIFKIVIETFLLAFAAIGLTFTCLAFYKGGVLQLDWDKLTADFKRNESEEVKVETTKENK